jgi:hypothetical protein
VHAAMATTATAGAAIGPLNLPKQPTLLPLGRQGNACKSRLPSASGGANLYASTKEAPEWTTRHPATSQKHADCRPLLQQSSPNRGQVVQPGKRKVLNLCA